MNEKQQIEPFHDPSGIPEQCSLNDTIEAYGGPSDNDDGEYGIGNDDCNHQPSRSFCVARSSDFLVYFFQDEYRQNN